MRYRNSEMKLDQLIGYFNSRKISLIPPFQRGHVWGLPARRRLLENMVKGRPIPAIFLYKQADGSQFAYNILDGKQRLESLILFIGDGRQDLKVNGVKDYFFDKKEKRQVNFQVELEAKKRVSFKHLPDEIVRSFREYAIPTIEIDLDDDSSLDEVINLFVDINQQGVKVNRFTIIKAIGQGNKLLKSVLGLVAVPQTRKSDKLYKRKSTVYTRVLDKLQSVESASGNNQKVDRMWERLVEIALFTRTGSHRQPGQVLKAFIKTEDSAEVQTLSVAELAKLKRCFGFLEHCYATTDLGKSRLARDLPHFYTMVTTLISSNLLEADGAPPNYPSVRSKLVAFAKLLPDGAAMPDDQSIAAAVKDYKETAARQTTHPGRRKTRGEKFLQVLEKL